MKTLEPADTYLAAMCQVGVLIFASMRLLWDPMPFSQTIGHIGLYVGIAVFAYNLWLYCRAVKQEANE